MDMFWIVGAVRHGIPVWVFSLSSFFAVFLSIANRKNLSDKLRDYRTGYLITLWGLFMAGWMVHYWDMLYAFFMFLLGSGMWLLDYEEGEQQEASDNVESPRAAGPGYSRFGPRGSSHSRKVSVMRARPRKG